MHCMVVLSVSSRFYRQTMCGPLTRLLDVIHCTPAFGPRARMSNGCNGCSRFIGAAATRKPAARLHVRFFKMFPVAVVDISRSSIWPGVLKLSSLHPTDNRLALLVAAPPASHLLCFVSCRSDYSPSVWFDCSNWRSQPLSPQRLPLASLPQAATAAPRPTFLSTKGEALLAPPQEAGGAGQASGLPCHLNVFHCLVPPCAQWANSSCTPVGQSSTVARTYGILNVIE